MASPQDRSASFRRRVRRVASETGYRGLCLRASVRLLLAVASRLERAGMGLLCSASPRFLTQRADRERLKRNAELAEKHRGDRCYILGNGPSLQREDVRPLVDEICFTVNKGHRFAERAGLRPRYHVVVDPSHLEREHTQLFSEWEAFQRGTGATFLLSTEIADGFAKLGIDTHHYAVKQYLVSTYYDRSARPVPIDLSLVQPGYTSVIHFAIIAALYMGFSDIRLLGCDMDFFIDPDKPLWHSYDEVRADAAVASPSELFGWDQVDLLAWALVEYRAFRELRKLAEGRGARIVNASSYGILNVFPREPLRQTATPTHETYCG
jgi:hypothetical protein